MNTNTDKVIADLFDKLNTVTQEHQPKILEELYIFVLDKYESGEIDEKGLAYTIAGTLQFPITKTDRYKRITEISGELELPDEHVSGNKEEKLNELLELLKKLKD